MFDKHLFDKNAFDRSVSSSGASVTIISTGEFECNIQMITPFNISTLTGSGTATSSAVALTRIGGDINGEGDLNNIPEGNYLQLVLRNKMSTTMDAEGNFESHLVVKTPMLAALSGSGEIDIDDRVMLIQHMRSNITGVSQLTNNIVLRTSMEIAPINGSASINAAFPLKTLMQANLSGNGTLLLNRISELNEEIFELKGISLAPGQTVIIDTNLLQVWINSQENVANVTTDSVFFELNPGINEIKIQTDKTGTLDVTAIWQNRWL